MNDPVVDITKFPHKKGSFWLDIWMYGLGEDPEIEHSYDNKEANHSVIEWPMEEYLAIFNHWTKWLFSTF